MENLENDLHTKAGLVYTGEDFEGNKEWIGTDEQWEQYSQLELEQELPNEVINLQVERD